MEHVVFFSEVSGESEFRRVGDLEEAVRLVETLRNDRGIADVSLHSLTPIPVSFRTYYRVEVGGADAGWDGASEPAATARQQHEVSSQPFDVPASDVPAIDVLPVDLLPVDVLPVGAPVGAAPVELADLAPLELLAPPAVEDIADGSGYGDPAGEESLASGFEFETSPGSVDSDDDFVEAQLDDSHQVDTDLIDADQVGGTDQVDSEQADSDQGDTEQAENQVDALLTYEPQVPSVRPEPAVERTSLGYFAS